MESFLTFMAQVINVTFIHILNILHMAGNTDLLSYYGITYQATS
jgi:hypothetical protein